MNFFSLPPSLFSTVFSVYTRIRVHSRSDVTNSAPTEDQRASQPKDRPSYMRIRVRSEDDPRFVLLSLHRKKLFL